MPEDTLTDVQKTLTWLKKQAVDHNVMWHFNTIARSNGLDVIQVRTVLSILEMRCDVRAFKRVECPSCEIDISLTESNIMDDMIHCKDCGHDVNIAQGRNVYSMYEYIPQTRGIDDIKKFIATEYTNDCTVVVWPEVIIGHFFLENPEVCRILHQLVDEGFLTVTAQVLSEDGDVMWGGRIEQVKIPLDFCSQTNEEDFGDCIRMKFALAEQHRVITFDDVKYSAPGDEQTKGRMDRTSDVDKLIALISRMSQDDVIDTLSKVALPWVVRKRSNVRYSVMGTRVCSGEGQMWKGEVDAKLESIGYILINR